MDSNLSNFLLEAPKEDTDADSTPTKQVRFEALDTSAVEAMVDAAIAQQADAWAKYCAGEEKAMGALVGAIMKASQGKADGKVVTAILQSRRG